MTARQMVHNLQEELYKSLKEDTYDINTDELLYYLNKSQLQFVKREVTKFELNQYITDELEALVKTVDINTIDGIYIFYTQLPSDYSFLIRHRCTVEDECGNKKVSGVQVTHDSINRLLDDPFWEPILTEPLYYISTGNIVYEVPNQKFKVKSSTISYVKIPVKISVGLSDSEPAADCELAEFTHEEIVTAAAMLLLEDRNLNK